MAAAPVSGAAGAKATGEGTATGADDAGRTTAAVCVEPPWHDVPSPRSAGAAMVTGSTAASGVGEKARTAVAPSGPAATGAAADEAVTEQQKSMASRKNTQPRVRGVRERHRCRSVRVLTLVIARHRNGCMKIQRIWVALSAG